MTNLQITRTFPLSGVKVGFVRVDVENYFYNDYYYVVPGQEPVGPYADEEDAYRGYHFSNFTK